MPDAIITSTESTFGTISGTFANTGATITGTITGVVAGTLDGSVGVPGPVGPAGATGAQGPQGIQGIQGVPGPGLPAGGLEGQIIVKNSDGIDYDTEWVDNYSTALQATVRNETGATLTKGTVVYINGAAGNKATVTKASAAAESTSSKTFAILSADILNNQNGQCVTVGLLKGVDTSAFTAGANLWLSVTPGLITQTPPTSPDHSVFLGNVIRVHATQGEIEVRIANGVELGELHDVLITTPTNGQVLKYDSTTSLWKNQTDLNSGVWGSITGTLSSQTDLQTALDGKYSTTNPAGYITSAALTGLASESWVTAGFYPLSGNPSGFLTASSLTGYATESFVTSQGYITSAALSGYLTSATAASTYQTLAGMSSYLTTATAASTYYPLSGNPSSFLVAADISGKANIASPTFTGTVTIPSGALIDGYATTASLSAYAPLASPTFTGTPTLPTGTIAVTQTAGNNTTAVATTAFVQQEVPAASTTAAGKVELATVDEALRPSSSTLGMTPDTTREMLMYPGYINLFAGGNVATSGTGAASTFTFATQRWHAIRSPNASVAGYGMYIFDYSFQGIGMAAMTRGSSSLGRKWNNKIWVSGRTVLGQFGETTSGLNGDANCTARVMLGGRSSAGTGGMQTSDPGIGWRVAGGGSVAIVMTVSNGTTLTETTSSFTPTLGQVFDWKMYSDGTGNVTLWVNDSQVATSTGGPSTSTAENNNFYCEVVEQTSSAATPLGIGNFGSKVFWSQA